MIDMRSEPAVTLETALLTARLAGVERSDVLVTYEQLVDVYTELQEAARYTGTPPVGQCHSVAWRGLTFRTEEVAA